MSDLDISKEITEANARLPIDVSQVNMPLDITIRSIALSVAQRHCGDTTVKEGNLYQQRLELRFVQYLHPDITFPSTDDLVEQLKKDVADTRRIVSG